MSKILLICLALLAMTNQAMAKQNIEQAAIDFTKGLLQQTIEINKLPEDNRLSGTESHVGYCQLVKEKTVLPEQAKKIFRKLDKDGNFISDIYVEASESERAEYLKLATTDLANVVMLSTANVNDVNSLVMNMKNTDKRKSTDDGSTYDLILLKLTSTQNSDVDLNLVLRMNSNGEIKLRDAAPSGISLSVNFTRNYNSAAEGRLATLNAKLRDSLEMRLGSVKACD